MAEQKNKKNDRIGMGVSIGLHVLLLLVFAILLAYREPDPPLPQYGMEMNFGLDAAGSGDIQPDTPANESESQEDPAPEEPAETTEEVVEDASEQPVETPAEPTEVTEPVEEVVAEETITQPDPADVATEDTEPVVEDTQPEEVVEDTQPEEVVEDTQAEEEPAEESTETDSDGADGDTGTADEAPDSNQGDDTDAVGDAGDPEGDLDARADYGSVGGGGGGSSLNLKGWAWEDPPKPQDDSSERGRIVFEISVDDFGEIIGLDLKETTVSPAVVQKYKDAVLDLYFIPTGSGDAPPISKGTITFIITNQ